MLELQSGLPTFCDICRFWSRVVATQSCSKSIYVPYSSGGVASSLHYNLKNLIPVKIEMIAHKHIFWLFLLLNIEMLVDSKVILHPFSARDYIIQTNSLFRKTSDNLFFLLVFGEGGGDFSSSCN